MLGKAESLSHLRPTQSACFLISVEKYRRCLSMASTASHGLDTRILSRLHSVLIGNFPRLKATATILYCARLCNPQPTTRKLSKLSSTPLSLVLFKIKFQRAINITHLKSTMPSSRLKIKWSSLRLWICLTLILVFALDVATLACAVIWAIQRRTDKEDPAIRPQPNNA